LALDKTLTDLKDKTVNQQTISTAAIERAKKVIEAAKKTAKTLTK
jgi:hypothetical protein